MPYWERHRFYLIKRVERIYLIERVLLIKATSIGL